MQHVVRPVHLGLNEMPYAPDPVVLEAASSGCRQANRYPIWDASELRAALAQHFGLTPDWVAAGTGSSGIIQQLMMLSRTTRRREVLFSWPSFDGFPFLAKGLGMPVCLAGVRPDGACDLDDISRRITSRTALVIICTPNAPTGGVLHHDELLAFLRHVPKHITVLLDEAYVEYVRDVNMARSLELIQTFPNVVIARTFSKAYGLAGLRVGYGIAQPKLAARLRATVPPFAVSLPAQLAAIQALKDQQTMQARVETIVAERQRLASLLQQAGATIVQGHGNFVWLPLGEASQKVADALRLQGVFAKLLTPHGVRISVGTPEETDTLITAWKAIQI